MSDICDYCKEKGTIISDDESGKFVCQNCGKECEGRIFTDENDRQTFEGNDGENKIQRVAPYIKSDEVGTIYWSVVMVKLKCIKEGSP